MNSAEGLHRPVLVLNASYEPINVCAARRALVLILKGVASAEEHVELEIHSSAALHADAFGDPPARIPADSAPVESAFAQEHPDARPLHLPVLPEEALAAPTLRSTT